MSQRPVEEPSSDPASVPVHNDAIDEVKKMNAVGIAYMKNGGMVDALKSLQDALNRIAQLEEKFESNISTTQEHAQDGSFVQPEDIRTAKALTLNNLGCLFRRINRPEEALQCLLQAANVEKESNTEKGLSPRPNCSTLLNLSTTLLSLHRGEEALQVARDCCSMAPSTKDDFMLVVSLHNMAMCQQYLEEQNPFPPRNQGSSAETLQRAYQEALQRLGPEHSTTQLISKKVEALRHTGVNPQNLANSNGGGGGLRPSNQLPPLPPGSRGAPPTQAGGRRSVPSTEMKLPQPPPGGKLSTPRSQARLALRGLNFATPTDEQFAAVERSVASTKVPPFFRGHASSTTPNPNSNTTTTTNSSPGKPPVSSLPIPASIKAPRSKEDVMRGAIFTPMVPPSTTNSDGSLASLPVQQQQQPETLGSKKSSSVAQESKSEQATNQKSQRGLQQSEQRTTVLLVDDAKPPGKLQASECENTQVANSQLEEAAVDGTVAEDDNDAMVHQIEKKPSTKERKAPAPANVSLPPFARFATHSFQPSIPPTTFADIRQELKLVRAGKQELIDAARRAEKNEKWLPTEDSAMEEKRANLARRRLELQRRAEQRKALLERELREEQELIEHRRKTDAMKKLEQEQTLRIQRVQEYKSNMSAQKLQRWWRRRMGDLISEQSRRKNNSANFSLNLPPHRRYVPQKSTALNNTTNNNSSSSGGFTLSQSGQLKSMEQATPKTSRAACVIQRCVRAFISKKRFFYRRSHFEVARSLIMAFDRQTWASRSIQKRWRHFQAKKQATIIQTEHRTLHTQRIQRWWRRIVKQHAVRMKNRQAHAQRLRASTTIQRLWRGYLGRVRAAFQTVKAKIMGMKRREERSLRTLQRIGRGFLFARRALRLQYHSVAQRRQRSQLHSEQSILVDAGTGTHDCNAGMKMLEERLSKYQKQCTEGNRFKVVTAIVRHETDTIYTDIVRPAETLRDMNRYVTPVHPQTLRWNRAAENTQRELELDFLRRQRSAKLIQRTFRRWRGSQTAERHLHFLRVQFELRQRSFEHKLRLAEEAALKEKRHLIADPAKEVRELKDAAREEMKEVSQLVRNEITAESVRGIAERTAAAQNLHAQEVVLQRRLVEEQQILRELCKPTTFDRELTQKQIVQKRFLTQKEKKALEAASGQNPEKGGVQHSL